MVKKTTKAGIATKTKTKAGTKPATRGMRKRWNEKLATWKNLLPRRILNLDGLWRFALPETDKERLAAGWTRAPRQVQSLTTGEMVPSGGWTREPQPLFFAERELADVAIEFADAAVTLRVSGCSVPLRQFARELRKSCGWPSRNPSLLLPDVELVVADVLLAHEADSPPCSDRAEVPFDFTHDAVSVAIAKALWDLSTGMRPGKGKGGGLLAKCDVGETTFKDRIGKMHAAKLVDQLGEKRPWFLTDKGRALFAPVLGKATK